ncbi:MAG: hypothetical protein JNK14_06835 [Chitinophagaceae bacterium]|nr:hypothetical protein [Chitinophagaceae bacterium]
MPHPRFCILFLLMLYGQLWAQLSPKKYSFTHYGNVAGLVSNEVLDVTQDPDGYMWIATNGGLQRFDGVRFISFTAKKNDPLAIPENYVSQVMIDKKKNLWIMSGGIKAGIFDTKRFQFKEVPIQPSDPRNMHAEKRIITDEEGNIFLMLWNVELLIYDEKNDLFKPAGDFVHMPAADWKVTGMCQLPGTSKYIIGTSKGTVVYNKQSNQYSYAGHNTEKEDLVEKIGKLTITANFFVDNKGRLWFDSWHTGGSAIYCYDLQTQVVIHNNYSLDPVLKAYHEIRGMMQQRNGEIWVKGLGVFGHYLEKEKQFQIVYNGYENEQSIYYDRINALFEDNEENIWIATSNNGLYRFNPKDQFFTNTRQVHRVSGKPGNGGVMSLMPTKWGTILTGTWGDGLYNYDKDFNMVPLNIRGFNENSTPSMWSMYASKDSNTIWVGAQPGIWKIDQAARTATDYYPPALQNRTVRQIAEDRYGNLWLGTQSIGVFKWDAQKGKKHFNDGIIPIPDIPQNMILKITVDKQGYVWVCTSAFGLYVIDPASNKVIMHFSEKEPPERKLIWDAVASVLQYDDTTMIIAARGFSIYSIPQQRIVQTIGMPDLFGGNIQAIEKDKQGYLWVSSTSGIYRVNIRNKIFIRFDRVDGIVNDRFIVAASYVLPDGRILFGAENQLVSFHPDEVQINNFSPDVRITGFRLGNRPLLVDSLLHKDRIELAPKNNSIAIEFSGLSYNAAFLIRYKLEGLDKDWIVADKNYQAIYSYLPPGTYTFMARSEDAEGVPGKNITRLVIHINPPFWKTWWFFCLLALVIAAVFYWLDKQRVNKLVALQDVRTEIASNLHEDVNATLNNINVLSEMAKMKADKDIERSKEYIGQISNASHNMIIAMDDILWSIDPQNDNMERSLLRMMEFADALKNRHGANIELALDKKVRSLKLDMKIRHEVFIIFKEALRMIVQYSGGRETLVHIDLFKNKLSLKLQDAGATLDKNTTEIDNCIKEMNDRSAAISADLDVQYDKNGIAVILLVPVK